MARDRTADDASGWTHERKAKFLAALGETSNVSAAVRVVNMSSSSAYQLRARDPDFARAWMEALEQGYCELEMLLLRHALHGSEQVETVEECKDDEGAQGKRTTRIRTVRSHPHGMAERLLSAHRESVEAYRLAEGIDRAGGEALRAEIHARIDAVRGRSGTDEPA